MKLGRYQEAAEHWEYVLKNAEDDRGSNRSDAERAARRMPSAPRTRQDHGRGGPGRGSSWTGQSLGPFRAPRRALARPGPHHFHVVADGREGARLEPSPSSSETFRSWSTRAHSSAGYRPSAFAFEYFGRPGPPRDRVRPEQDDSGRSSRPHHRPHQRRGADGRRRRGRARVHSAGNGKEDDVELLQRELAASSDPNLTGSSSQCRPPSGEPPKGCTDLRDALDAMDTARHRATGSFIAAGAFGVATIATYLLWPASESRTESDGVCFHHRPGPTRPGAGATRKGEKRATRANAPPRCTFAL